MSEEHTQNMPDSRTFEESVFARFDMLDVRLDAMVSRPQKLETESDIRTLETNAWERALAQILELRRDFDDFRKEVHEAFRDISRKFGVPGSDMIQLRADQTHLETRLDNLESKA